MKKILLVLTAIALISLPVIMNSCEEEEDYNSIACSTYSENVWAQKTTYIDYGLQSLENCENYKDALRMYLDHDCDDLDDDDFKTIMDNLPC